MASTLPFTYSTLMREVVDRRLRRHCGDNGYALVAWVRSVLLTDDQARELLYKLDATPRPEDAAPTT